MNKRRSLSSRVTTPRVRSSPRLGAAFAAAVDAGLPASGFLPPFNSFRNDVAYTTLNHHNIPTKKKKKKTKAMNKHLHQIHRHELLSLR
jgi:hypothetical protein